MLWTTDDAFQPLRKIPNLVSGSLPLFLPSILVPLERPSPGCRCSQLDTPSVAGCGKPRHFAYDTANRTSRHPRHVLRDRQVSRGGHYNEKPIP